MAYSKDVFCIIKYAAANKKDKMKTVSEQKFYRVQKIITYHQFDAVDFLIRGWCGETC